MKIKIGKLVIAWADDCELERCTYYTHYLRYGPPTMSHAAFHRAEADCLQWQKRAEEYWRNDHDVPHYIDVMCRKLEAEIRA